VKHRSDIDGLRGSAVLLVLGYHIFPDWVKGGFIGVDIFFVISGYLITQIILRNLENNSFRLIEFFERRVIRIFPSLVLVLFTTLTLGWFILLPEQYEQLGKHTAGASLFVSNFILWSESGYFDQATDTKPLAHLWSLGVEEQFYIFWPFIIWCAFKTNKLVIPILFIALSSFSLNVVQINLDPAKTFFLPHTRFWELLVGALMAILATKFRGSKQHTNSFERLAAFVTNSISVLGILLLILAIVVTSAAKAFPGWWALLPVVGTALLVLSNRTWVNQRVLSNRVLVWFGLISYPLYLWHIPVLFLFRELQVQDFLSRFDRIFAFCISVGLSWLTYRIVEKPLRYGRMNQKILSLTLLSFIALIGIFGFSVFKNEGYKQRFTGSYHGLTGGIEFEYQALVRQGVCHMEGGGGTNELRSATCYESKRPLVALWGDSAASTLYPGLKKLQSNNNNFGISQLTNAGCPPILGAGDVFQSSACQGANESILTELVRQQPNVLILTSVWNDRQYLLDLVQLAERLTFTIRSVQEQLPLTRIVVVGPIPRFKDGPQMTAYRYFRGLLNKTQGVPIRLPAQTLKDYDAVLREVALNTNTSFVSVNQILCNIDGCISRVGDNANDFIAIDTTHLSAKGAEFLTETIKQNILPIQGTRLNRSPREEMAF